MNTLVELTMACTALHADFRLEIGKSDFLSSTAYVAVASWTKDGKPYRIGMVPENDGHIYSLALQAFNTMERAIAAEAG